MKKHNAFTPESILPIGDKWGTKHNEIIAELLGDHIDFMNMMRYNCIVFYKRREAFQELASKQLEHINVKLATYAAINCGIM